MMDELINQFNQAQTKDDQAALLADWYYQADRNEQFFDGLKEFANKYAELGYADLAITILQRLYQQHPNDKIASDIAHLHDHIYEYQDAYEWLSAMAQGQLPREDRLLKARLLRELGQTDEAKNVLAKLINEAFDYHPAYFELADIYIEAGDISNSRKYVEPIYEYFLDEEIRREARLKLVQLELSSEQIDLKQIEKLLLDETLPVTTAIEATALATAYYRANQYEEAIKYAEQAVGIDSDATEARYLLLELYKLTGKKAETTEEIEWFDETHPEDDGAVMEIARQITDSSQLDGRLITRLKSYFDYTDDLEDQYIMMRLVVLYYLDQSQPKEALSFLNHGLDSGMIDEDVSYLLAKTYQATGLDAEVEDYYQLAIDNLAPEANLISDFVAYLIQQEKWAKAHEVAQTFIKSQYSNEQLEKQMKEIETKQKN